MSWVVDKFHKRGWLAACEGAATNDDLFSRFRRNTSIIVVVASEQHDPKLDENRAKAYRSLIQGKLPDGIERIDKIGSPIRWMHEDGMRMSREMCRYLWTKGDIEKKCLTVDSNTVIIEIGGGFGGQRVLFPQADYTIIDYHECGLLQKRFCRECGVDVRTLRAESFDCMLLPRYDLIISNYAFDELEQWQQEYYMKVVERCDHGYFVANRDRDRMRTMFPVKEYGDEPKSVGSGQIMTW